jgi:hypothetical protein
MSGDGRGPVAAPGADLKPTPPRLGAELHFDLVELAVVGAAAEV